MRPGSQCRIWSMRASTSSRTARCGARATPTDSRLPWRVSTSTPPALRWIVGMRERTFPGLELHLPTGMIIAIAVLGLVIGVVAAILPARRAARLDPLAALRYE